MGGRTATLGLPGTGVRYTASTGGGAPRQAAPPAPSALLGLFWLFVIGLAVWMLARAG
jgi:hypothetical protein